MNASRHTGFAIALHWAVALAVVFEFAWGWWMQSVPAAPPGARAAAFNLHKSVGLAILLAMAVRLAWRLRHPPPPAPPMPAWQRRAAAANHALLYGVLIAMAIVGYLGSVFSGYPVRFFGWTLPAWGGKDPALKALLSGAHLALSWLLAAGVALHVAAVARHQWLERVDILSRMLPARGAHRPRPARLDAMADAGGPP